MNNEDGAATVLLAAYTIIANVGEINRPSFVHTYDTLLLAFLLKVCYCVFTMTIVIAYPGTGKSTLAEKYSNVADPDFPFNNINIVKHKIGEAVNLHGADIVMFPFTKPNIPIIREALETRAILKADVIIVYPSEDCADDYERRYKGRDKGYDAANVKYKDEIPDIVSEMEQFDAEEIFKIRQYYENTNGGTITKVELKLNQNLSDALVGLGVKLVPKDKIVELPEA